MHQHIENVKRKIKKTNLVIFRTRREISTLDSVAEQFREYDRRRLIDYVHNKKNFPEIKWEEADNRGNTSIPISIDSIRRALGFTDSEIAEIHTEDELLERENAVLGIEMKGRTFWAALDPWETERHLRFVISDPDENNLSLQPPETHPPQQ